MCQAPLIGPWVSSPTLMRRSHLTLTLPSQPGTREPQRISLFGAKRLAVLAIDDKAIVQAFFERQAAVHARGVGAFDHHPLCFFLQSDFVEQGEQILRLSIGRTR